MKKNFIWGLATAALLSTSMFSCKKDNAAAANKNTVNPNTAQVTNVNGRVVFRDSKALDQTINELMSKDPEALAKWEKSLGVNSLRNDSTAVAAFASFGFPDFYESIINNKGEYMIGDTIVYFNNGYKHLIPNKDEAQLAKIKANPSLSVLKFTAGSRISANSKLSIQATLENGYIDAHYQYEFLRNGDNNSKRKLVFEVLNYIESTTYLGYHCFIHTRIKQEYLGGNKKSNWLPAGEPTEKKISGLSYNVSYAHHTICCDTKGNASPVFYNIKGSGVNASQSDGNNLDLVLCSFYAWDPTVNVSIVGDYYASVLPPFNSDGKSTYIVNNATW